MRFKETRSKKDLESPNKWFENFKLRAENNFLTMDDVKRRLRK